MRKFLIPVVLLLIAGGAAAAVWFSVASPKMFEGALAFEGDIEGQLHFQMRIWAKDSSYKMQMEARVPESGSTLSAEEASAMAQTFEVTKQTETILRPVGDSMEVLLLVPSKKCYVRMAAPKAQFSEMINPTARQMKMMGINAHTSPTGDTQTIQGLDCEGYAVDYTMNIHGMSAEGSIRTRGTYWISSKYKLDSNIFAMSFADISIPGLPVGLIAKTDLTSSSGTAGREKKTSMVLTNFDPKPLGESEFQVPPGFRQVTDEELAAILGINSGR